MAANREETTHGRTPDRPLTSKGLFINVVIGLARPPELPMIRQVLWQKVNQLYEKFVLHKRSLRMCFLCCYFFKNWDLSNQSLKLLRDYYPRPKCS